MDRSRFALFVAVAAAGASVAIAQLPPPQGSVEALVRASIRRVAAQTGILVDPLITQAMTQNALIFTGNFCYPPPAGLPEPCSATINKPVVLDRIVNDYLTDLVQRRPTQVETLAARLARRVGDDIGRAGWPDHEPNEVAVVSVPAPLQHEPVALQGASGPTTLGARARFILVRPGRHVLVFGTGTSIMRQVVSVTALGRVALQPGASGSQMAALVGRVDAPSLNCPNEPTAEHIGPLAIFNWGRGRYAERATLRQANLTAFATQPAIAIRVVEETAGTCNRYCLRGFSVAFARAIAVWRGGCERCGGNMLAVIKIGNNVWLDVRAADRLRALAARRLTTNDLDLTKPLASEIQRTFAGQQGAARVSYDQADSDPALSAIVCATPSAPAPWFGPLKSALCSASVIGFGPLRPTLALRNAQMSCGAPEDFLACGVPGGNVEITLTGSRYSIPLPDGTRAAIGASGGQAMNLSTVLVHEVGHWFGVPHSEVAGGNAVLDIMSQTYDPRRACLSSASNIMLNNAADKRWSYTARSMMGLRRRSVR